jgi:resuscitation-promoting factor RpfA
VPAPARPPITDVTPAAPDSSTTATTIDASPAPAAKTVKTRTVTRTTHTVTTKPTPTHSASAKSTPTHVAAAPAPPPPPPPAQPVNSQSSVAPVVDLTAKPANQPAAAQRPSTRADETLPIAGGALVALLALGGAAYAVSRRRRREDAWNDEWVDEPATEHQTVEQETSAAPMEPRHDPIVSDGQPEIAAPSAFAWDATQSSNREAGRDPDDDRLPGETWVQRAYRGPSANNPSVSLKNRLGRAAFFDKRERDVAAGLAEPVGPDAGLPDGGVEESGRELA